MAWIEAADRDSVSDVGDGAGDRAGALDADPRGLAEAVVLVDDADRLGQADLDRLAAARRAGTKLVLVLGTAEDGGVVPGGPTFEVFAMSPLSAEQAGELVRRTIPSLPDAVVAHVVARAAGWPGRARAIVAKLAGAPVGAPADVDRLMEDDGAPVTGRGDLERLLDRGHFDEAAELLTHFEHDNSPEIAVARARLLTNQGDSPRALAELERVRERIPDDAGELAGSFHLTWARAQLRGGGYPDAERSAGEAVARLGFDDRPGDAARTKLSGTGEEQRALGALSLPMRRILGELIAVRGLAQSFAARHAEARATLESAVRVARSLGEPRLLSLALGSLAFALQRDDHLAEAKNAYEEGLAAAEEAGDAGTVATTRLNLATIAKAQGDVAATIVHLEAAVDMGRRSGRVAALRQALLNLANLDLYLGRLARARVSIDALAAERGDLPPQLEAQLLALEAEYAQRSGDFDASARLCRAAAEAYQALGRTVDEAEARLERVLYLVAGPHRPPIPRISPGRSPARPSALLGGAAAHRVLLLFARAKVAALAGDTAAAREAYDEALEAARASGQKDWVWRAHEARAQLELEAGQTVKARRDREAALTVLEEIAERLPRDLREVFWNDPRRKDVRAASMRDLVSAATVHGGLLGEDRLARVLEINRAIAGELDLARLLEKVTDHAIALLRAERGFVILKSGYARAEASHGRRLRPPRPEPPPPPPQAPAATLPELFHPRLARPARRRSSRALLPVHRRRGDVDRPAGGDHQRPRRRAHGRLPLGPPAHAAPVGGLRPDPGRAAAR